MSFTVQINGINFKRNNSTEAYVHVDCRYNSNFANSFLYNQSQEAYINKKVEEIEEEQLLLLSNIS
jgi:hypothetical protein